VEVKLHEILVSAL